MKNIKKLVGLALALALALSLAIPAAFAADTGTITITNVAVGETYGVYKIFDLDGYTNAGAGNYAYTIKENSPWYDFIISDVGEQYITLGTPKSETTGGETFNVYPVSWKENAPEASAQAFAQEALAYAPTKGINPITAPAVKEGETQVKFTVDLGYYLIDSSLGALCGLTTTHPDASLADKNNKPSVVKQVKEDSNNSWGPSNDADIGQVVDFQVTMTAQKGAENYVLHDTMTAGLNFDSTSVKVTVGGTTYTAADNKFTVVIPTEADADATEPCTFHIVFDGDFLRDQAYDDAANKGGVPFLIEYSATLNEKAVAYSAETNTVQLTYGDKQKTEKSETTTYTYGFELVKINDKNTVLEHAKFELYRGETDETPMSFLVGNDGIYRVVEAGTEGAVTEFEAGQVKIAGLDADTYWLKETAAPTGYNLLKDRQKIELSESSKDLNEVIAHAGKVPSEEDATQEVDATIYDKGGVPVINKSGSLLPETGGIGTTIFYIGGGILAVGAVILLIVRRRMRVDAE